MTETRFGCKLTKASYARHPKGLELVAYQLRVKLIKGRHATNVMWFVSIVYVFILADDCSVVRN